MLERRWHPDTLRLQPRAERAALKMAQLGPRPLLEFCLEIGCELDGLESVILRMERYAALHPEIVRAMGADKIRRRRPVLVP